LATDGATTPVQLFCLYFLRDGGFGRRNARAVRGVADALFFKNCWPGRGAVLPTTSAAEAALHRRTRPKGYCPPPELTAKSLIGLGAD
jgi:hypothetical protein